MVAAAQKPGVGERSVECGARLLRQPLLHRHVRERPVADARNAGARPLGAARTVGRCMTLTGKRDGFADPLDQRQVGETRDEEAVGASSA